MSERPGTMQSPLAAPPAVMPPGASAASRAAPPMWLYGVAVFAAAWLVFWVQPLSVRGVLPVLGGSPAVWNTAMVFFQAALLGGYALAHLLARRATPAGQLVVLGCLWAGVALTAPIGELRILGEAPAGLPPALWLLGTLAGALGLAFVAASSLTPLVQSWLARAGAGAASADPYFLYAASNAGSAGALLAFPFLLEPFLGLERQAWAWSAAALGLAPLLYLLWRAAAAGDAGARAAKGDAAAVDAAAPARALAAAALPVVRILALAAVPSALLLGVTRYLTTDVAAVPLLWIVPLALYLATFVHAFARRSLVPQRLLARLLAPALIALVILYLSNRTVLAFGLVHLLVFALAALYCHGALARLRPPAADLTRFYLLVSTGGLIGGMLVALVAPVVFTDVHEYPIALAAVAALLPAARMRLRRGHYATAAVALGVVVAGLAAVLGGTGDAGGTPVADRIRSVRGADRARRAGPARPAGAARPARGRAGGGVPRADRSRALHRRRSHRPRAHLLRRVPRGGVRRTACLPSRHHPARSRAAPSRRNRRQPHHVLRPRDPLRRGGGEPRAPPRPARPRHRGARHRLARVLCAAGRRGAHLRDRPRGGAPRARALRGAPHLRTGCGHRRRRRAPR